MRKFLLRDETYNRMNAQNESSLNGSVAYYFDEHMNEIGYTTAIDRHKKMNTSTAGRIWHQSILNNYIEV